MTSETVVVELSREQADAMLGCWGYAPEKVDAAEQGMAKITTALASDSQGGEKRVECDGSGRIPDLRISPATWKCTGCSKCQPEQEEDGDWPETIYRVVVEDLTNPAALYFGPEIGDLEKVAEMWRETGARVHRYVPASTQPCAEISTDLVEEAATTAKEADDLGFGPANIGVAVLRRIASRLAPTQPSLSEEDRGRLERIAALLEEAGEEETPFEAARFLRHLASAPPEVSGEETKDRCPACGSSNPMFSGCKDPVEAKAETGRDFPTLPGGCANPWHEDRSASPPEPSVQEDGGRWTIPICKDCGRVRARGIEHSRSRCHCDPPPGRLDLPTEVMPVQEHEATVERLRSERDEWRERSEAVDQQLGNAAVEVTDLQARLEKVEAERDESISAGLAQHAALEEAAQEFDRQANELLAHRDSCSPESRQRMVFERAAGAHRQDAQLLREKQAALKGGGAGGE